MKKEPANPSIWRTTGRNGIFWKKEILVPFTGSRCYDKEGKIVRTRYDKFRQINRFLEFIEDILPQLPSDREDHDSRFRLRKIVSDVCDVLLLPRTEKLDVNIIGLDLKEGCHRNLQRTGGEIRL